MLTVDPLARTEATGYGLLYLTRGTAETVTVNRSLAGYRLLVYPVPATLLFTRSKKLSSWVQKWLLQVILPAGYTIRDGIDVAALKRRSKK